MNKSVSKKLGLLIRLVICVGLLAYIIKRIDVGTLTDVLAQTAIHWPWLIGGILFTFLGLFVGVLRWKEILIAQGLLLSLGRVFQIFFIGQFFNAFMLGACGGDVARAYYATLDTPGRRAEAASTVFVDRAIGLFTMIVFCCVMIVLRIHLFLDNQGTRIPGFLMFFFLIGSIIGIFALFRRNLFEHWHLFRRLEKDTRLGPKIRRTYDAFYLYRGHPRVLFVALVLSLLNQVFLTLACFSFGQSLHATVSLLDYFTLFPIISVIAAVPITPGSLGVREGLFVTMFQAVDVDVHYSMPMSLMVYAGSLVWSLFGGLFFLGHTAQPGHTLCEELGAIKSTDNAM